MSTPWRIAGINFDHMHMGDLLRMVHEHPGAELVGICDEQPPRMEMAARNFQIPRERIFTDYRACLERTKPDLVILCPAAAEHGLWTQRAAEFGVNVMVEKPFAASLAEADAMIAAQRATGKLLAINWPLRWAPCYVETKRLIDGGEIGEIVEFHHYGGNRGPLHHTADKIELTPTAQDKARSWFYQRARGGGSLLDYAGYGATLGTWFQGGRKPIEVTCMVDEPAGFPKSKRAGAPSPIPGSSSRSRYAASRSSAPTARSPRTIMARQSGCRRARIRSLRSGPWRNCARHFKTRSNTFCTCSKAANSNAGRCTRRSRASASRSSIAPRSARAKSARWRWWND